MASTRRYGERAETLSVRIKASVLMRFYESVSVGRRGIYVENAIAEALEHDDQLRRIKEARSTPPVVMD